MSTLPSLSITIVLPALFIATNVVFTSSIVVTVETEPSQLTDAITRTALVFALTKLPSLMTLLSLVIDIFASGIFITIVVIISSPLL